MPKKERKTLPPLVPLFTDGLHFVREASEKDQHPLRFLVYQHKVDGLPNNIGLPRHCESLERGIEIAKAATKKACKADPVLHLNWKISQGLAPPPKPPKPTAIKVRKKRIFPPGKVFFSTSRFTCIIVNPVAQIWVCTKHPYEVATVGRRTAEKRLPQQQDLPHKIGEFAVLKGDDPVVDYKGVPKVFEHRVVAEELIKKLYAETPEDECFPDNNNPDYPTTTVYANSIFSVHFDVDNNSPLKPFNIYNYKLHKPYLQTRANLPMLYKSITTAINKADELERKLLTGY